MKEDYLLRIKVGLNSFDVKVGKNQKDELEEFLRVNPVVDLSLWFYGHKK